MATYYEKWQAAKKEFEKDTGKKKPSKKFLSVFRISAGLDNAAQAVDKANRSDILLSGNEDRWNDKQVKAFASSVSVFKKKSDEYLKLLDKAIKEEALNTGDEKEYYRSLKVLRATLDELAKNQQSLLAVAESDAKNLSQSEKTLKYYEKMLKGAVAAAVMWIQKIKKDPIPAVYNEAFADGGKSAGRNITQIVANLGKYAKNQQDVHLPISIEEMHKLVKGLGPWATEQGRERKLPMDATQEEVLKLTKNFAAQVKDVVKAFKL